jgi:hypothetical protein
LQQIKLQRNEFGYTLSKPSNQAWLKRRNIMKTSSWVIVNKATGVAIFETFNENTAKAVNTRIYKAVPILEYLQSLNKATA